VIAARLAIEEAADRNPIPQKPFTHTPVEK
jgi:hypothetical protein